MSDIFKCLKSEVSYDTSAHAVYLMRLQNFNKILIFTAFILWYVNPLYHNDILRNAPVRR